MTKTIKQLLGVIGVLCLLAPVSAHAVCTNPAGNEGDQIYNSTHKTMQFCDGTNWFSMKGGAVSGGITVETDPEVGTLTNGRWCTTDGTVVNCTSLAPSITPVCTRRTASGGTPTATCLAGEIMTGGGCNEGAQMTGSYPPTNNSWTCTGSSSATAYAICCAF